MQLIDTHVHLNFDVFSSELEEVRSRWQAAGVTQVVHSCVEPGEFSSLQAIADRFPEVSLSIGLHPLDAHKWNQTTAEEIWQGASSDSRVVAIGEMGLDFYKADNIQHQQEVFLTQLEIACQLDLPVIIHCRDAASALRQACQSLSSKYHLKGVMHCWSGTPEETRWFLDLGFYLSFSGIVTFKNAHQVQESALVVPSDRLLVETDCPFLAPLPYRGKRNEPAYVYYVAQHLAELRKTPLPKLARETTENARQLFALSLPENATKELVKTLPD
ncbi:TatD family hydrolase [Merismopedia glauca]|uniref:TatD family hydrolase n=1 Tax=Merismopedia glauca TaxID=292586 RepID=UPI0015E7889D|nr:TatD family hydrolase [Merismopedia glauca]